MNNIKNWNSFINEELNKETYLSAAEKLKEKGHIERSNKMIKHAINKDNDKSEFKHTYLLDVDDNEGDVYNDISINYDDGKNTVELELNKVGKILDVNSNITNRKDAKMVFDKFIKEIKEVLEKIEHDNDQMLCYQHLLETLTVNDLYKK
jgi:hypothetical protein